MRTPRNYANTGYMHLIVRGNGRQILFEAREDYQFYLRQLRRISREENISVLCYCLMENHVHLLVYNASGNISRMMSRLNTIYAKYFNQKYERVGHLFQNRYLNENIYTDEHLLVVFRYILNNPVKAGICRADRYEWSSYRFYCDPESFVDTSLPQQLIGDGRAYAEFITQPNNDECLDIEDTGHRDEWAMEMIDHTLQKNGVDLQQMSKAERNDALRKLKQQGLSVRQIERLTGISRNIIQRA